ncbi:hypothetical protein MGSAQ_001092 [marine sediment metagenome]|uniref:Uncharacterized protein n=1 Tax=marine sediment metagenome TaxID=412755 RepID=A0A1B6NWR7_9ZZZZ
MVLIIQPPLASSVPNHAASHAKPVCRLYKPMWRLTLATQVALYLISAVR